MKSRYIYGINSDTLFITTREHWEKHKTVQTDYTDEQLEEIQKAFEPFGVLRIWPSRYQCYISSMNIQKIISSIPQFEHHQTFQKYINKYKV